MDAPRTSSAPLTVAFAGHSSNIFGAERVMLEATHELTKLGHKVHIALPKGHKPAELWLSAGDSCSFIPVTWWMTHQKRASIRNCLGLAKRVFGSVVATLRWLHRTNANVVITNSLAHPETAIAAYLLRIPHIWYIHEFANQGDALYFTWGKRLSLWMVRRLSTTIIVNSNITKRFFSDLLPEARIHLLYYGMEAPSEKPVEPRGIDPLNLVVMGSIATLKRQEDAIRATAILVSRGWNPRLRIVGSGHQKYLDFLKRLTADLHLDDRVTFVASISDPYAEFDRADLSIVCSCDESFGRVTVEAMKAGRPVVGAAAGGTLELVRDGVNGYLFAPRDPLDLADKVALAASDPAHLTELARNAQHWSRATFDPRVFGIGLETILQDAVSDQKRSCP